MLKQISATVVALSFLLSPALADKKPEAPKCLAPASFTKSAKPRLTLQGDDLARFRAKLVELIHKDLPIQDTDLVMIAGDDGSQFFVGVMFVKGCAKGIFLIDPKAFAKATTPAETL